MAIIDSHDESANSNRILASGSHIKYSQSFTGDGNDLDSASFKLHKSGSPTGNVTYVLYAHSGTYGSTSEPTGTALATSETLDASTITGTDFSSATFEELTFNTPYTTVNGTKYCLVVEYSGNSGVGVLRDTSAPIHDGNSAYYVSSWITESGSDLMFYAYTAGGGSSISSSVSSSISSSISSSVSSSISSSPSPSTSISSSISFSISSSPSSSLSPSSSPSPGYQAYTRGDYAVLPTDDADLENDYTAGDLTDVATKDNIRVGQTATSQYAIHQFKDHKDSSDCLLEWEGKTNLAPSSSTVYLQIYNRNSATWETVDSDSTSAADIDFVLAGSIPDLTDYKDGNSVVSCRVYQLGL